MWYKPAPMHSAEEQRTTRESTHIQCGTSQHRCTLQRSSGPHGSPHTFNVVQASTDALCRGVAGHMGVHTHSMWYKPAPMHSAEEQRATRESTHIQCGTSQHRCTLQMSSGPHGSPHTFNVVQASTDALCR